MIETIALNNGCANAAREAEELFGKAVAFFAAGNEPGAMAILISVARGDWCKEVRSAALNNLGQVLERVGQDEKAMECYAMAVELCPDSFIALTNYGQLLKDFGFYSEAIQFQRRAMQLSGDELPQFRCSLVELLTGDLAQGFENYEARLALLPDSRPAASFR